MKAPVLWLPTARLGILTLYLHHVTAGSQRGQPSQGCPSAARCRHGCELWSGLYPHGDPSGTRRGGGGETLSRSRLTVFLLMPLRLTTSIPTGAQPGGEAQGHAAQGVSLVPASDEDRLPYPFIC